VDPNSINAYPGTSGQIDTNALDTPEVPLPVLPCARTGCTEDGTLMAKVSGAPEYTFWCVAHVPAPPILTPPASQS
jgi:hypothetical protein